MEKQEREKRIKGEEMRAEKEVFAAALETAACWGRCCFLALWHVLCCNFFRCCFFPTLTIPTNTEFSSMFLQSMFLPTIFPLSVVFFKSTFLFVTCHWRPPSQYIRWWCLKSCYRHKICVCPNSVMQSFRACPHPISLTCVSSVATF